MSSEQEINEQDLEVSDVLEINDAKEAYEGPSTNVTHDWIKVTNQTGENHMLPDVPNEYKYGKWLIFRPTCQIDQVFEAVKDATIAGELGYCSSVSTLKAVTEGLYDNHVICVFTYDENDEEDSRRIRECLARLGVTEEITYKSCTASYEGLYYRNGDRNFTTMTA